MLHLSFVRQTMLLLLVVGSLVPEAEAKTRCRSELRACMKIGELYRQLPTLVRGACENQSSCEPESRCFKETERLAKRAQCKRWLECDCQGDEKCQKEKGNGPKCAV